MKQRLLLGILILFSVYFYGQGLPPPCGFSSAYACDNNGDGFEVFNLREEFIFDSFCVSFSEDQNDYDPIVYYETEVDMLNEVNPIITPESYVNISKDQIIYYRANAITANADFKFISATENSIRVLDMPTPNLNNLLTSCKKDDNGFNIFYFTDSEQSILAGLNSNLYNITYYNTLFDAENASNQLPKNSYINTSNLQIVYVKVSHKSFSSCFKIVELELTAEEVCNSDIEISLVSYRPPRPGFDYYSRLVIKNNGLKTVAAGSVEFTHDPLLTFNNISFLDSSSSITATSTGFILDFVDLQPKDKKSVRINMNIPIPTPLGTLLTNKAFYSVTDLNVENNESTTIETVIGSYDPNDIKESRGPEISHADFSSSDYLYYTIRFQNVGTADAINVSIDNTLDSRLDKSTIQMLNSSHSNVFTRVDDKLNWKFDNIHLPSEDMDEPNSHGFVYYKIKPTTGYSIGDIIPNTAEIYFDFNEAVITNTFETQFITTLSNSKFSNVEFLVYPNPAKNSVVLKFNNTLNNLVNTSIYDIQGKLILNSNDATKNNEIQLNVSFLKSGLYFLRVNDGILQKTEKLIIE